MARLTDNIPLFAYENDAPKVRYLGGRQVLKQQQAIWKQLPATRIAPYQVSIEDTTGETSLFLSLPERTIMAKKTPDEDQMTADTSGEKAMKEEWNAVNNSILAKLQRNVARGGGRWAEGGHSMVPSHVRTHRSKQG